MVDNDMPRATSLTQSGTESSAVIFASSAAAKEATRASAGSRNDDAISEAWSTVDVART